jgi:hypothetical protein
MPTYSDERSELVSVVMAAASQSPDHVKTILQEAFGETLSSVYKLPDAVKRMDADQLRGLANYLRAWQAVNHIGELHPANQLNSATQPERVPQRPEPIGPPSAVRQTVTLGLEQLSVTDLAKLVGEAARDSKECDIWIFWKNGELTQVEATDEQSPVQRLESITRTEEIRRVNVEVKFLDESRLNIDVSSGQQLISSASELGNSLAQSRVSALKDVSKDLEARSDDRLKRGLRRKTARLVGINIVYALFAATFLVEWNVNHRPYSAVWWSTLGLAVTAIVVTQIVASRSVKVSPLDAVVRRYPAAPQDSGFNRRNIVDGAQVVGAIAGVIALIVTISQAP